MTLNKEAELLKDLPLFSKVDLAKLKLLAFTSERLTYDDNQIVLMKETRATLHTLF